MAELRTTHETDLNELQQKLKEVDHLRMEIERLAGEVIALRGIVEEGLEERRKAKEVSELGDGSHTDASANNFSPDEPGQQPNQSGENDARDPDAWRSAGHVSPEPSMTESQHVPNRTMRTDHATAGSSHSVNVIHGHGRFIQDDELERVSAELEERRSERSEMSSLQVSREQPSYCDETDLQGDSSVDPRRAPPRDRDKVARDGNRSGRTTPQVREIKDDVATTPFPQIRGEHLERLFFSAPEHDARTCRVCHRRRRPGISDDEFDFPSWMPPRKRTRIDREEVRHTGIDRQRAEGTNPDDTIRADRRYRGPFSEDRLPPQTVLVRVLRELEDDFTHYKGCVHFLLLRGGELIE